MISPESVKLTFEKSGVQFEGVPLERRVIEEINSPSGHKVDLGCAIWKREKDHAFLEHERKNEEYNQRHETESLPLRKDQVVFISGFGSGEIELPTWFHALGKTWETVIALAHPDAPSSKIKVPADKPELADKPLNENSFANSGFVELRAIEKLIDEGTLEKGTTVIAYSTGCPVMLEAVRQDIAEHPQSENRLIKNLILLAPAGILDRGNFAVIAAGGGASMKPYFDEYIRDLWHAIKKPFTGEKYRSQSISLKELTKNVLETMRNPDWKNIRAGQIAFEVIEFIGSYLPIHDFLAWFHRTWSNPAQFGLPHLLPETPSVKKNQELIAKDATADARVAITDTNTIVCLFTDDKAVPPDGFLNDSDRTELDQIDNSDDKIESTFDLIIKRVKEKFPNNRNQTRVIIGDGAHHITPKVDLDVVMQILANKIQ